MAANTGALDVFHQHPANDIISTDNVVVQSNKSWPHNYAPISNLIVHTAFSPGGRLTANYEEAFLPLDDADRLRLEANAVSPNKRAWYLNSVADRELWFHTEISNVVLPAWNKYPAVAQMSHPKPQGLTNPADEVPIAYSMQCGSITAVLAVGEIKKNAIDRVAWQSGNLGVGQMHAAQRRLSQELRGHACKFQCPQVFCFDGKILLLLQFRAERAEDMLANDCPVDLPMMGSDAPWRIALHKLLAQAFRLIQGACALPISVGGLQPLWRRFFNGQPVWAAGGGRGAFEHPGGYVSYVDVHSGGVVKWWHAEDPQGVTESDGPFWTG